MKGKVISFTPKMKDNQHDSFTSNDKTFYAYVVTAEVDGNLTIGDAYSTTTQPKWVLNTECEITVDKNEKATGGNKFKISTSSPFKGTSGKGYSKPIDERMEIISQSAFSTAIKYIEILEQDERKALFEKYGPDDAFINFSIRISKEIVKNAKTLVNEHSA